MSLLSTAYRTVAGFRNRLYDSGVLPAHRLSGPVVSVGNLSVGGSGKTPFILLLGEMLQQRGLKFDVLSRGYGRKTRGARIVGPEGTPAEFGDEPLLIARRLGCPVVVGESRYEAGQIAERKFGPQLHLLDDGFQHRALARDFDIVLLAPEDLSDRLLPSGRLREPLQSLKRADAVVIPDDLRETVVGEFGKPVWRVRRELSLSGAPQPAVAFCGIARPQRFFEQLRAAGVSVVAEQAFRDHHAYTSSDISRLRALGKQHDASGFITTAKDAINLGGRLAELGSVTVAEVGMRIVDPADALDTILSAVAHRRQHT